MKAKYLLRAFAVVFVLCMLLSLACAAEDLDAKIIRFDGTGNLSLDAVEPVSRNVSLPDSNPYTKDKYGIVDGVFRIEGTAFDNYYHFNIAKDEQFQLKDYPYLAIGFKTNDAYEKADGQADDDPFAQIYLVTSASPLARGGSHTGYDAVQHFFTQNGKRIYYSNLYRNYVFAIDSSVPDGANGKMTGLPANTNYLTRVRFEPSKDYTKGFSYDDAVVDIEYIGFFKTADEAKNYGRPVVAMRFDDDERRSLVNVSSSTGSSGDITFITDPDGTGIQDGKYVDKMSTKNYEGAESSNPGYTRVSQMSIAPVTGSGDYPDFSFKPYYYRYAKIKMKSNWPGTMMQLYMRPSPYARYDINPAIFQGQYQTIELNYNNPGGNITSHQLTFTPESPVIGGANDLFLQTKGLTGVTDFNLNYYNEFEYIAFFQNEKDMKAYDTPELAAVEDAAAQVINEKYTYYTVGTADADAIAQYIKDKIENAVSSEVTVSADAQAYAGGDVCKVMVTFTDGDYAEKTIGFEVPVASFGLETLGVQFRTEGVQGLRFGAKITTFDDPVVEFGMLIIPAAILENSGKAELTHEVESVAEIKAEKIFNEGDGFKEYTAVLTGIPDESYEITARPYIKYTDDAGEHYVYGDSITRSVNDVKSLSGWSKD